MAPTSDERREVAERLRQLPADVLPEMRKWENEGLFIEPSLGDEVDYSQIHNIVLDCFSAEHMHPEDYEELHNRLADLIEPQERTCRMLQAYGDDSDEIERRMEEIVCTPEDTVACICQSCGHEFRYDRMVRPKYCPNCGRKVVSE